MNKAFRVPAPSLKEKCSPSEWKMRVDLAACYRLVDHFRMSDATNTHISARIPGTEDFLINPWHWMFNEVTASNLITVDADGKVLLRASDELLVPPAGYVIHSAIHAARPEVHCVLHTHTRAGGAVAAMKCGLLPINQKAMRFVKTVAYHDYEGPAVNLEERQRLSADLGSSDAMILRNHGLITCAPTIAEAFNSMLALNRACEMQVDAMASGTELIFPSEEVITRSARHYDRIQGRAFGIMEWPAMLRLVASNWADALL